MSYEMDRRDFMKKAAAAGIGGMTLAALVGCQKEVAEKPAEKPADKPADKPAEEKKVPEGFTEVKGEVAAPLTVMVGTTLDNLKAAIGGETGAEAKYLQFAEFAKKEGHDQIARLFTATAAAEKIHYTKELEVARKIDPKVEQPKPDKPSDHGSKMNLAAGFNGEIYECTIMYPEFIKVAEKEGNKDAVEVFKLASAAEGYHAGLYMDLFNTIDKLDGASYYGCPICGYIRKGDGTENCPICDEPQSSFKKY